MGVNVALTGVACRGIIAVLLCGRSSGACYPNPLSNSTDCKSMKIQIFCVGGTIDKIYFDAKSKYEVGSPAVAKMLQEIGVDLDIEVSSLMAKDSLEMTDDDRAVIAHAVKQTDARKIIITHGTDTMPDTARSLGELTDKAVVLTGALAPAIFKDSDAMFNVGGALAAVQALEKGVYIVMNGELFDATNVRKDVENNRFVRLT